jgi:hypothetical protein
MHVCVCVYIYISIYLSTKYTGWRLKEYVVDTVHSPPKERTKQLIFTARQLLLTHKPAYVSIRQRTKQLIFTARQLLLAHKPAYGSIRQHTSAYVSIRQHTSAYVSHTSAIRQPYQH